MHASAWYNSSYLLYTYIILNVLYRLQRRYAKGSTKPAGAEKKKNIANNQAKKISRRHLLSPTDAVRLYQQNGCQLTDPSNVGQDPLAGESQKSVVLKYSDSKFCNLIGLLRGL